MMSWVGVLHFSTWPPRKYNTKIIRKMLILNASVKCSLTTYLICFQPKYPILQKNICSFLWLCFGMAALGLSEGKIMVWFNAVKSPQ